MSKGIPTKNPLRCFCDSRPLMAFYGVDKNGELYLHTKVFRQSKIYSEILFTGGTVKIRCRRCLRWHKITFKDGSAKVYDESAAS